MDAVTALRIAFVVVNFAIAALVMVAEGMRYYRTLGDLDDAEHAAYYHERIWDPRDERHEHE